MGILPAHHVYVDILTKLPLSHVPTVRKSFRHKSQAIASRSPSHPQTNDTLPIHQVKAPRLAGRIKWRPCSSLECTSAVVNNTAGSCGGLLPASESFFPSKDHLLSNFSIGPVTAFLSWQDIYRRSRQDTPQAYRQRRRGYPSMPTAGLIPRPPQTSSRPLESSQRLQRKPHFASITLWRFLRRWGNRGMAG